MTQFSVPAAALLSPPLTANKKKVIINHIAFTPKSQSKEAKVIWEILIGARKTLDFCTSTGLPLTSRN
jgi:hypothetical protein